MKTKALVVIDLQNALVEGGPYEIETVIKNVTQLIDECRSNNVEVIYVQHCGPEGSVLEKNTTGWEIYSKISPNQGEKVVLKYFNSAFRETELQQYLQSKNLDELIIVGMQTEFCIDTSIKVGFELGYKLVIPEMTNTTYDNGDLTADKLYNHYNYNIFNKRFARLESMETVIDYIKQ